MKSKIQEIAKVVAKELHLKRIVCEVKLGKIRFFFFLNFVKRKLKGNFFSGKLS